VFPGRLKGHIKRNTFLEIYGKILVNQFTFLFLNSALHNKWLKSNSEIYPFEDAKLLIFKAKKGQH